MITLHGLLRLKKLSTEAPEGERDPNPYTRRMTDSNSGVRPPKNSLLRVADIDLQQFYCTPEVDEVHEKSSSRLSVETILDSESGFTYVSERLVERLKAHFPGEQQLVNTFLGDHSVKVLMGQRSRCHNRQGCCR